MSDSTDKVESADNAELVKDINELMMDMNVSDVYGSGATKHEGRAYMILDRCLSALTQPAATVPIGRECAVSREDKIGLAGNCVYCYELVTLNDFKIVADEDGVVDFAHAECVSKQALNQEGS